MDPEVTPDENQDERNTQDDVNTARLHHDSAHREVREHDTTVDETGLNPDTDLFQSPDPEQFRQA